MYVQRVNSKQRKTLKAVFQTPVLASIDWSDIEALLTSSGAKVIEGSGSRVRFECNGEVASFHRPHPDKKAKRYQVREARAYLNRLGVKP